jgi:AcrR family transcriptional regulator
MAPYPARVDRDTIIQTAREMIEEDGLEGISLNRLAKNLGIKAPSLYHHVKNKTDLLETINAITIQALLDEIDAAAAEGGDDRAGLRRIAQVYRHYALAHPVAYDLLYAAHTRTSRSLMDSAPLNAVLARLVGPDRAPDALRSLWALLHGFVELERTGYLLTADGGERSWRAALDAFLAGWVG